MKEKYEKFVSKLNEAEMRSLLSSERNICWDENGKYFLLCPVMQDYHGVVVVDDFWGTGEHFPYDENEQIIVSKEEIEDWRRDLIENAEVAVEVIDRLDVEC